MRGCAVGEGVVHGGELGLDVGLAQTHHLEGLDHDLRVVVPHGTGGGFVAVDNQIVLVGLDGQQLVHIALGVLQRLQAALGHGEGIVAEFQSAGFLADLVHGEIHDPAQGILLLVKVAGNPLAQQGADDTGGLLGNSLLARRHADEAAGLQIQLGGQRVLALRKELGNAAGEISVFVHLYPAGLAAGLDFHVGQELVDPFSRLGEVVHGYGLDGRALEGGEAAALHLGGDVLNFQIDTQVGLVGAVALHGFIIRNVAEGGGGDPLVLAELVEHGHQHVLQNAQHVRLTGEGHLHIQLIKFAGGAVGTGVLVPEAGGDLEVTVKAGGHQQLLELLGCLRQGIELSGVVPGGHQIVPGTLRGGGGQDGGGDLQEAMLCHGLPQGGHYLAPEDDVVLHRRVPQVQIAVLQAGGLVGLPAAVDGERQLVVLAAAQHLNFAGHHLDLAGGQLGVLAVPLPDGALHGDGGLLVDGLQQGHHVGGLRHHLSGAIEVPDHGEGQLTAYLPEVFQPAADLYGLAGVGEPQLSAGMGAILCHDCGFLSVWKCDYK